MKELLDCGFDKITEAEIEDYTGEPDTLADYEEEDVSTFAYCGHNDYCIFKLKENDAVLRYIDGSNNFIVKIDNQLYMGYWNECENDINDKSDCDWANNLNIFSQFKAEMKKKRVRKFYIPSF